jgi:hypothetical protein
LQQSLLKEFQTSRQKIFVRILKRKTNVLNVSIHVEIQKTKQRDKQQKYAKIGKILGWHVTTKT